MGKNHTGLTDPIDHLEICRATWKTVPQQEWVDLYIHTLDLRPGNSYTLVDLGGKTLDWDELANNFQHTFRFTDNSPMIDVSLHVIKDNIF